MYYLACCTRTVVFVSRNRGCSFEGANYGTCRLHRWDSQKHTQAAKYRVVLHGGTPTGTCVSVSHACLRIRRKPLRIWQVSMSHTCLYISRTPGYIPGRPSRRIPTCRTCDRSSSCWAPRACASCEPTVRRVLCEKKKTNRKTSEPI